MNGCAGQHVNTLGKHNSKCGLCPVCTGSQRGKETACIHFCQFHIVIRCSLRVIINNKIEFLILSVSFSGWFYCTLQEHWTTTKWEKCFWLLHYRYVKNFLIVYPLESLRVGFIWKKDNDISEHKHIFFSI